MCPVMKGKGSVASVVKGSVASGGGEGECGECGGGECVKW